jgi:hypothetical protein
MKEIIKKLNKIREYILSEKDGTLRLFCIIARNDFEGKWDILFSADWIEKTNSEKDLVYLITKLKLEFDNNLDFLSNIFVGTPNETFIKQFMKAIGEQDSPLMEEINGMFVSKELTVRKLYVIACDSTGLDLDENGTNEGPVAVGEVSNF